MIADIKDDKNAILTTDKNTCLLVNFIILQLIGLAPIVQFHMMTIQIIIILVKIMPMSTCYFSKNHTTHKQNENVKK